MYPLRRFFGRLVKDKFTLAIVGVGILTAIGFASMFHWGICSGYVNCLTPAGTLLFSKEAGVLAAVVAVSLSFYQFVYLRPEMLLDVDTTNTTILEEEDGYSANLTMYLVNAGNQFAEDVQLTFALDAFKFDDNLKTPEYPDEDYRIKTTTMDTQSGRKSGYIGGGRRHDIFFDNIVYERDVHNLYYGNAISLTEGLNEIKYSVGCRAHGLRKGKIILFIEDGELRVLRSYPTLLRQLKGYFGWTPDVKRTQRVENIDDVDISVDVN